MRHEVTFEDYEILEIIEILRSHVGRLSASIQIDYARDVQMRVSLEYEIAKTEKLILKMQRQSSGH
jgi:hypothetical protein